MTTSPFFFRRSLFGLLFLCLLAFGCGKTEKSPSANPPTTNSETTGAGVHPAAVVVEEFLAAMVQGDHTKIRMRLTPLARQKGEEKGIPFSPPASRTASFTVLKTVPQGELGAYVYTDLVDLDDQGRKESADIIWVVAKTEEGWRVAGAAVSLFEGQDKTVINFEDPEAAQQAIADAEMREQKNRNVPTAVQAGRAVPISR